MLHLGPSGVRFQVPDSSRFSKLAGGKLFWKDNLSIHNRACGLDGGVAVRQFSVSTPENDVSADADYRKCELSALSERTNQCAQFPHYKVPS